MNEIINELGGVEEGEERLMTWLDMWFLVLGSVIDLAR